MEPDSEITDQGVLWTLRPPYTPINPNSKLTLERMISVIRSEPADRQANIDDFWLRSKRTGDELQVCVGHSDRVALLYVDKDQDGNSPWLWSVDQANAGSKIRVWDPGCCEWDIPTRYFILKERAIKLIEEFWRTGEIKDTQGWANFDFDEIDVDYDNSCGHEECRNPETSSEQDDAGKPDLAVS